MDIVCHQEGDYIRWDTTVKQWYLEMMLPHSIFDMSMLQRIGSFVKLSWPMTTCFWKAVDVAMVQSTIVVPNKTRVRGFIDIILFEYTGLLQSKHN